MHRIEHKAAGRGRAAAAPPLKEFDASPVTGNKIVLRDGRYGLYVNDGETNASLPKDISGDDLTFEQAVDLLAARAAAGGSKKKTKRSSAKKSTTKKKTTTKPAAKKATPKKFEIPEVGARIVLKVVDIPEAEQAVHKHLDSILDIIGGSAKSASKKSRQVRWAEKAIEELRRMITKHYTLHGAE